MGHFSRGLSSLLPFPYLYPTWIFGAGDSEEFWPTGAERFFFLCRPPWLVYHHCPLAAVLVRKSWAGSPSFARWRWDLSSDNLMFLVGFLFFENLLIADDHWWLPSVNPFRCNCDILVFGVNEKTANHNYHSSLTFMALMKCTLHLLTYSTFLAIKSVCWAKLLCIKALFMDGPKSKVLWRKALQTTRFPSLTILPDR